MNTFTDEDLTVLESLEFEPACMSSFYHPTDPPPAAWVIYFAPQRPCGCPQAATVALFCDHCKDIYVRGRLRCPHCGAPFLATAGYVLRIEPLR